MTLRTLFSSTAGQGFQNTKWPAILSSYADIHVFMNCGHDHIISESNNK